MWFKETVFSFGLMPSNADQFAHLEEVGWMGAITQQWILPQQTAVRFTFLSASVTFTTASQTSQKRHL